MLIRSKTGTLVYVERKNFISDKEYYMYIKKLLFEPKQIKCDIVEKLTHISRKKPYM
jgi:hypothetical protein